MHNGLLNPDGSEASGLVEARQVADEIDAAPQVAPCAAHVAIIFDYEADFTWSIQPHGKDLHYFDLVFDSYRAARSLGLSIDILPPEPRDITRYKLVLVPGMIHMPESLKADLATSDATVIIDPRSASRTRDMQIPVPLPPNLPGFYVAVTQVESLRPDMKVGLKNVRSFQHYCEHLTGTANITERTKQGKPAIMRHGNIQYLAGWPDPQAFQRILAAACTEVAIATYALPKGLRLRDTAAEKFWFNYSAETQTFEGKAFAPASD